MDEMKPVGEMGVPELMDWAIGYAAEVKALHTRLVAAEDVREELVAAIAGGANTFVLAVAVALRDAVDLSRAALGDYQSLADVLPPEQEPGGDLLGGSLWWETDQAEERQGRYWEAPVGCCGVHNPVECCDPEDCGPCCRYCPTCPTVARMRKEDVL